MRPSTLDERRRFYIEEFDVKSLSHWIGTRRRSLKFAMILGRYTGIVMPGREENKNDVVVIDLWKRPGDIRRYALDYLPESLYYDRNRYIDVRECARCGESIEACHGCFNYDGQQLAFDLDPENVDCPYHGHLGEKSDRGRIHGFCMYEFKSVRKQASRLSLELAKQYESVGVVYSGRGFHVVVDDEAAYRLTKRERKAIARTMGRRYDIDEWVTEGGSRLMRLPYSLNATVSRKCVRIKDERGLSRFDPRTSLLAVPEFTKSA
jgi:DNA primase catalytic subunit